MIKIIMALNTLRDSVSMAKLDAQYARMAEDKETREKYLKSVDKNLSEAQIGLSLINLKLLIMHGKKE